MLMIDRVEFGKLVQLATHVALRATDPRGLRIIPDLPKMPRDPDADPSVMPRHDMERISAIMLGALVAICASPLMLSDTMALSGFVELAQMQRIK